MTEPQMRYLKNTKTGVVFPETRLLKKMRNDLIPCTKQGIPIAPDNVDMPMLYNPFTGALLPNTGDNSIIPGLIPCRDKEHAESIKAALMGVGGDASNTTSGLVAPPQEDGEKASAEEAEQEDAAPKETQKAATQEPQTESSNLDALRAIDVYAIEDKYALRDIAAEHFGEKLSMNKGLETLREQVQVMINSALASEAA